MEVQFPLEELAAFCKRWEIVRLELFGSALRDDFTEKSDLDLLVTFREGQAPDLFAFSRLKTEIEKLLGRSVDVMTRKAIEKSRNPIRKEEILRSAKVIYDEAA